MLGILLQHYSGTQKVSDSGVAIPSIFMHLMQKAKVYSPPRYLAYLDSARGIAAMMVLLGHFVAWKFGDRLVVKASMFLFNAHDAVSFFFVLSGMVLSYQYLVLDKKLDLRKYFVNRFFRLFPAFFITVLLNALYWQRSHFTLPAIVNDILLGGQGFWKESLLLRSAAKYYVPGWTLVVELSASFLIPFMIVIARSNRQLLWWLLFALLAGVRLINGFLIHFILGVTISAYYFQLCSEEFTTSRWYRLRYPILLLAIGLFSIRRIQDISPFGPDFYAWGGYFQIDLFFYTGIASFVFLAFLIRSRKAQQVLMLPLLRFLGKISYGIYLMHWLVVCIIFDYWDYFSKFFPSQKTAFLGMCIICVFVSILLAYIIHHTVELPFIKMGKRFTEKMKPGISV
ncbi:MAG: acyltransferase [Bacteroidetes bacterium]|nr:acyltransferase [Bacteroidota bacterium]